MSIPMHTPPMMTAVGLSFLDLSSYGNTLADLLVKDGPIAADFVKNGLKLIAAVSGKDLGGIIVSLQAGVIDVEQIAADIKAAMAA